MEKNPTPAIIGGGYAGMAAAAALVLRGIPVTVYERARQLGGRARGVERNDARLDNGQHILLGCYRRTLELIERVGGDVDQDFLRLPLQLALHGRFELRAARLPAPLHLLAGLLTARGLPLRQRIAAMRFMRALRRMNFSVSHDIIALDLLRAHGQDERLIRLLWEPLCIAALNTPVEKASAQTLLNVLRDSLNGTREDSDLLLPRRNLSALFPDRAAHHVEQHGGAIRLSLGIEAIAPDGEGVTLRTSLGTEERHSHVICAASPSNAAHLLEGIAPPIAAQIRALHFQPIYTVYLRYPPGVGLPHPMLGLDRASAQWLFDQGRISGQRGLIAAVISAEGAHQQLDHAALAQRVAQEIRDTFGVISEPLWHQVIAEKRATFSCEPGLIRPSPLTPFPRLFLAGDYTAGEYPATLEGAVMSGLRCADLIRQRVLPHDDTIKSPIVLSLAEGGERRTGSGESRDNTIRRVFCSRLQ